MANKLITLRVYQVNGVEMTRVQLAAGKKRPVLRMPTGAGKTVVACEIMDAFVKKQAAISIRLSMPGKQCLFVAPRRELIKQTSRKLDQYGVTDHGVIMAGHPRWRPHAPVQVASKDTLLRRMDKFAWDFGLIIIDEAHHATSESIKNDILGRWPNAVVLGLTATPERNDGKSLSSVFDCLVDVIGVRALIDMGSLVDFDGFSYDRPDMSRVKRARGEYDKAEAAEAMREIVLSGGLIRDYMQHAAGTRALVFAINVEHSMAIVEQARANGIPAEHVDADTDEDIRDGMLGPGGRFCTGETLLVSNVGIATEGTDLPWVQTLILGRPTDSWSLAMQMLGRGLRTWCFDCQDATTPACVTSGHHIKGRLRIHDHAGVILPEDMGGHGLPDEHHEFDLEGRTRKCKKCLKSWPWETRVCACGESLMREAPSRPCVGCTALIGTMSKVCAHCGEEQPLDWAGAMGTKIVEVEGNRLTVEELRARRKEWMLELTDAQLRKVHAATRDDKVGEFLRLEAVRIAKQFKEGWGPTQFRKLFGHWPKFKDEELANGRPAERPFLPLPRR